MLTLNCVQALHACLVTDGVWRWTKPFDISTTSVQEIQLFVGINTATLYVHVTDLGGLQKQASMTAELFESLYTRPKKLSNRHLVYSYKVCTVDREIFVVKYFVALVCIDVFYFNFRCSGAPMEIF